MTVLEAFRLLAAEFSALSDETVLQWAELTLPLISKKQFGKLYEQAAALLTAHRMKLGGLEGNEAAGGEGLSCSIGDTLRVASYSEGDVSVSFNSAAATAETDADLLLTSYGVQYLALRRLAVIPIRCSGEVV